MLGSRLAGQGRAWQGRARTWWLTRPGFSLFQSSSFDKQACQGKARGVLLILLRQITIPPNHDDSRQRPIRRPTGGAKPSCGVEQEVFSRESGAAVSGKKRGMELEQVEDSTRVRGALPSKRWMSDLTRRSHTAPRCTTCAADTRQAIVTLACLSPMCAPREGHFYFLRGYRNGNVCPCWWFAFSALSLVPGSPGFRRPPTHRHGMAR